MSGIVTWIRNHKAIVAYGISLAMLLFLLRWLELRLVLISHSMELYIGCIALLFTALGIWLANRLTRPKTETVVVEKEIYIRHNDTFTVNESMIRELQISKRELEILHLLAKGLSNDEIAEQLFVSLSTIKTHNQRIFDKLDVRRRTQAVEKAKRLNIIP